MCSPKQKKMIYVAGIKIGVAFHKIKLKKKRKEDVAKCWWLTCLVRHKKTK